MGTTPMYKRCIPILQVTSLLFFLFPEVLFSLFLLPTKFASLTQKFNIPSFLIVPNILLILIGNTIIISALLYRKLPQIPSRLIFPFTGLVLLMFVSIFYSSNPEYGLEKTIEFVTLSGLACFAPFFLFRNVEVFERFFKVFILLGITLSLFIFASSPYSFQFYSSNSSYPQFQTTIGNNYLGLQYMVGTALLIIVYYYLFKRNLSLKYTVIAIFLVGLLAGALLYSPGKNPIISLFLTVIIMTFSSLKFDYHKILIKKKILNYAIFILVMGTIFLATIGWMFILRVNAVLTPGYYGQVERIENTKIAFDVFLNHPFFGAGIGSFSNFAAVFQGIERMKYPHNLPLEIASELGFTGLVFFLLLLGFAFRHLFYLMKKYRSTPYYNLPGAVFSFLVFTFLTSLTGGNIDNPLLFAWIGTSFALEPLIIKKLANNLADTNR